VIGYDSAFIGGTLALPSFISEFRWAVPSQKTKAEVDLLKANVVSLYQAGAFFGALFAYATGHFLGRQRGLTLFSVVFILGAGIMLGANGDRGLGLIYGGRVLAGIGVGGASNLVPICKFRLSLHSLHFIH
jgi:MFS family permease